MKTTEITNNEDVIDSRDVIARIEYLENELMREDGSIPTPETATEEEVDRGEEIEELAALKSLADEASGYASDWQYGEALIRDSYFEDYARELAEDIGAIPDDAKWPCTCIDWQQAADELRMDYTAIDFAGVTYWTR
jgi:hypothetical protein